MFQKTPPWRSEKWLSFVREQPCCNCGNDSRTTVMHAHHINGAGLLRGGSQKIADCLTIPVCARCHVAVHSEKNMIDQTFYALKIIENGFNSGVLGILK
ncbi:MAG: DUF968 domain-containing protein [Patescibacteria group bacterium]|nr:DUF968 domain-containing protein [Patescibacteria group bacterium]